MDNVIKRVTLPFTKRLITGTKPILVDPLHFTRQTNLRPVTNGVAGVKGMTKINDNPLTYGKIGAAFHYRKDQPSESHIVTQGLINVVDSDETVPGPNTSYLFDNESIIPADGEFNSDKIYGANDMGTEPGTMTATPNGCMMFANGTKTLVWGGNYHKVGACFLANHKNPFPKTTVMLNYTSRINNTLDDALNVMVLASPTRTDIVTPDTGKQVTVYIGSTMAIKGANFTVSVANTTVSSQVWAYWNGYGWDYVSGMSDGTISNGRTLGASGAVSFTSTVGLAKPVLIRNIHLFFYRITFTVAPSTTTAISYITLNTAAQPVIDLWDGVPTPIKQAWVNRNVRSTSNSYRFDDKTTAAMKEDGLINFSSWPFYLANSVMDVSGLAAFVGWEPTGNAWASNGGVILIGSDVRLQGLYIKFVTDPMPASAGGSYYECGNSSAASVSVWYYGKTGWAETSGVVDGTSGDMTGGRTLNTSGTISWNDPGEVNEFKTTIQDRNEWYYYALTFSVALGSTVFIDMIQGIPVTGSINPHKVVTRWQNRAVLLNESGRKRNRILVGGKHSSCVFNGTDIMDEELGSENTDIMCAGPIALNQGAEINEYLLACTRTSTFLVSGSKPEDWVIHTLSDVFGCVAPNTFIVCDLGYETIPGVNRHIAVWQAANGLVMYDGSAIKRIDDDLDLFDPDSDNYINPEAVKWNNCCFDENLSELHFLYCSGSSTVPDKEAVLNLKYMKWFFIDRGETDAGTATPLCHAVTVRDTYGNSYMYGFTATGYMERLEYGSTFDGNIKSHGLTFAPMPLTDDSGIKTRIERMRVILIPKESANDIVLTHYADDDSDGTEIARIHQNAINKDAIDLVIRNISLPDCVRHTFALDCDDGDDDISMEPVAIVIGYKVVGEEWDGYNQQNIVTGG